MKAHTEVTTMVPPSLKRRHYDECAGGTLSLVLLLRRDCPSQRSARHMCCYCPLVVHWSGYMPMFEKLMCVCVCSVRSWTR